MKDVYICIVPIATSPPSYEMKDALSSMGYEFMPTPIASSWCNRADGIEKAKEIIREANELGFGTAAFARQRRDLFVDLADEDMMLNNELQYFKREHGLS